MSLNPQPLDKPTIGGPLRASYTPDNAKEWKPVFDAMLNTLTSFTITEELSGYKPTTLYIKANDALKWLIDSSPSEEDRMKYANLRCRIVIRKVKTGVELNFKNTMSNALGAAIPTNSQKNWKDEFMAWWEGAQPGEIWSKREIVVGEEQKEWLMGVVSGVDGTELEVTATSIRVMR